jgi:protein O-mannosyl-transferase
MGKGVLLGGATGARRPRQPDPGIATRLERRWTVAAVVALIAINVAVYAPVRHHDFVSWDDPYYVTENANVAAGLTWRGVVWAVTTGEEFYWHPLTWLSHMVDVELFGLNGGLHHLTNVIIHIAATIVLFSLLRRATGFTGRSAFVAALFAVHPLHVESVAWIAERKDVLSGLFWMLALSAYAGYVRKPGRARYIALVLFFAAGLMSKPMVVTLPFVLLLFDVWPLRRVTPASFSVSAWLPLVREKLPLFALALAASAVTVVNQFGAGAVRGLNRIPLEDRVANALNSYSAYIGKMLFPTGLAAYYPYPESVSLWWMASFLGLAAATFFVLRVARRHPYLPVGWFWYLGTLVPVIGLLQVGNQAMADRFTYIPLVGLFVMVAWGVPALAARLPHRGVLLPTAAAALILASAAAARAQVGYWQDSLTLWTRVAEVAPGDERAHGNLGIVFEKLGRTNDAIYHYSEAARRAPESSADLHHRIGGLLVREDRLDEAIERFAVAARIKPDAAALYASLGAALERRGRLDEAVAAFSEAVRLQPGSVLAHFNLGVALEKSGRTAEAIAHYSDALRIEPAFAAGHVNLAVSLANTGRVDEAVRSCLEGLRLEPGHADWHYKLAVMYDMKGETGSAVQHLEAALRLNANHRAARLLLDDLGGRM